MSKTQTTIELNGKRYNALNGNLLESASPASQPHKPRLAHNGNQLDGIHEKHRHQTALSPRLPAPAPKVHHKTEHSHTLMRSAVRKPAAKKQSHKPVAAPSPIFHYAHPSHGQIERASQAPKSPQISKFGPSSSVVKIFSNEMPVKTPPFAEDVPVHYSRIAPAIASPFENALQHASSHNNKRLKKPSVRAKAARRLRVSARTIDIGAAAITVFILGSFIAYQNVPNVSMRVAAARSGVSASLPGYQPAGFSLRGHIQAQPGQITLTYRSHSDARQFTVSQRTSGWDDQKLIENYVAVNNRPYQTFQAKNKTVYLYGENGASWLDRGVWYQVEGSSSLNSDQLLRLAASM